MENSDKTEDLRLSLNEDIEEYNKPKLISYTKMNKYYLFPFITPNKRSLCIYSLWI